MPNNPMPPAVMGDERTVAQRNGLNVNTLRTLRSRGGGPRFLKVGRRVLYRFEDVDAWLAECPRVRLAAEVQQQEAARASDAPAGA